MLTNMSKRIVLSFIFLFTLLALPGCAKPPATNQTINIVFRYDDYSATSDAAFTDRLLALFRKYDSPITFSVIPMTESNNPLHVPEIRGDTVLPLTQENADLLRRGLAEGVLEVAMHGFSHQNNNGARSSEFTNVAIEKQTADLSKGKNYLESMIGTPVNIFVPPWNSYDLNTLRVLDSLGFSILSANRGGVKSDEVNFTYIPYTCRVSDVKAGVMQARETGGENVLLVVLLHEYEFTDIIGRDGAISFKQFSKLMKWLNEQQDIRIITLQEAADGEYDLVSCP